MTATVAVIGAGIAGLVCARELNASGHEVTVFDKGRGAGGRLATRRLPLVAFDHGAQYATARDPDFRAYLDLATSAGVVAPWWPDVRPPATGPEPDAPWFVGVPGMSALARPLATGLDVRQQVRIAAIERRGPRWSLLSVSGDSLGPYDILVLALPAPQALDLCEDYPAIVARLDAVSMAPCWAAMLAYSDRLQVPWDVHCPLTGALGWVARNSSKPGRAAGWDTWILHGSLPFSGAHLDATEEDVCDQLHAAFCDLTHVRDAPRLALAHRWRYARVTAPLGEPCVWEPHLRLGICGDWCLDARVEASWLSARTLAGIISVSSRPR